MNRYPLWKNILILVVLFLGVIYTLPNFYGEVPAVQISSAKATVKLDPAITSKVEHALKQAGVSFDRVYFDTNTVRARLSSGDAQLKAKDALEHAFNPDPKDPAYTVALNLLSASPTWLSSVHALPMYLGLDLRGGVHFLLQVDMKGAITKRLDSTTGDLRSQLREKEVRHGGIAREGENLVVRFHDTETRSRAREIIRDRVPDLQLVERAEGDEQLLVGTLTEVSKQKIKEDAIKQNITTLHNRINELGVAEPVIQQQGADRIVVQLPGVQDVAKAKDLIGRTATLEVRMVDEAATQAGGSAGADTFPERRGDQVIPVVVKKQIVLTGDRFNGASQGQDPQSHGSVVSVDLDAAGGRIMRDVTRENIGKRMAIILFERGKGEAISVATIQGEFSNRFQISGQFSPEEANGLAILIRSGSLAAPMEIIEERTIGPSLGADNIKKGFHSTLWGFCAIAVFMLFYYMMFGVISVTALAANLMLLLALLSLLQATLTLPGIAAIAFTLGMAIDSNVLINERIREELRNGAPPQSAISAGYGHAFSTILDSNVTTLIAGIALLIFGSGPIRGFAVVHCLGIITSMFSSVLVARMLTNFIYGRRRKLEKLSIGQIWKPQA